MPKYDLIIIGSGLAGLHAAYTPVQQGLRVLMIDAGYDEHAPLEQGAPLTFEQKRLLDPAQYKTFLGENLSGVQQTESGHAGAMTSGRRSYIVKDSDTYLPVKAPGAVVIQSLAKGGLSEAWGATCSMLTQKEWEQLGIYDNPDPHYTTIISRIGVSGHSKKFLLQPPAEPDYNSAELISQSKDKRTVHKLALAGFELSTPPLALLTQDLNGRQKTAYRDMDFWDNIGRSVYRGHYTLEELLSYKNFSYEPHLLAHKVSHTDTEATVTGLTLTTKEAWRFSARAVLVAAGAINTTRILLRSFGLEGTEAPIALKNNYLVPCLLPSALFKNHDSRRHSLCQLILQSTTGAKPYTQIYSYNSLMLHKLLRYIPLPVRQAFSLLAALAPALVLADIRFDTTTGEHSMRISTQSTGKEVVEITVPKNSDTLRIQLKEVHRVKKALRALGLVPLTVVQNPYGSTSHYAGGAPIGDEMLGTDQFGRVHSFPRIFVADSATWKMLPAKSPGLTIMANANRIGSYVAEELVKRAL